METPASTDPDGDANMKMLLNIFMVNFPTTSARDGFIPMVEMVQHLVPEAMVTKFDFPEPSCTRPNPSGCEPGSVSSGFVSDISLPSDWIISQARLLLELVRDRTSNGAAILLSGHGLGGILIKQAIATANSNPEFYHLASQVTCLVFFNTPHEPTGHQPWEGVLLELIKTTSSTRLQRGLYAAVSGLARHVSELSHAFIEFEPKYRIRNIVSQRYQQEHASPAEHLNHDFTTNSLHTVIEWPDAGELGDCALSNIPCLELLRKVFAPTWLEGLINAETSNAYFKVLEVLAPSNRILYENRIANATDISESLKFVYESDFSGIFFEKVRGSCVLVTASEGTGKSVAVKLLSQHLQTQSSLVVINNYPKTFGNTEEPTALYEVLVSTLRQILSQKPSLLTSALQTILVELLEQNTWGEGVMENLVSVLFAQARDVDFLVVVHDYQSRLWPDKARDWWLQLPKSVEHSHEPRDSSSTCTLLISRNQPAATDPEIDLGVACHHIDLIKSHRIRISDFVGRELVRIVAKSRSATSGLLRGQQGVTIRQVIAARAEGFSGSFNEISGYLGHLLQSFTLNTQGAIQKSVEDSPRTADEFYRQAISRLSTDETLLPWATATLSWALLSARPLQIQELACAAAIRLDQTLIGEMDGTLDIEADITNNLGGLLCVENGYVRVATTTAREALRKYTGPGRVMDLMGNDKLLKHCLHYLKMVLGGESGCLGEHTLLDYAARYWPAHFSAIENPDGALCGEVVKFFRESSAADRWYSLYFGHCSLPPNNRLDSPRLQQGDKTPPLKPQDGLKLPPVEMARDVGLRLVVSYLLAGDHAGGTHRVVNPAGVGHLHLTARRGGWERKIVIVEETTSKLYLECAIAADDVDAVATLLASEDENVRQTILSYRPLHIAALVGSPRMVQLIVSNDDVRENLASAVDEKGRGPLHLAAINGQAKVVRALLPQTVPGTRSPEGDPAGKGVNHGPISDPAARDKDLETPLHLAVRAGNMSAARVLVEFFRSKNEPVTYKDRSGRTPAHHAVESCPHLLKDLFASESKEELTQKDDNGLTPLHLAARGGCVEATVIILDIARRQDKLDDVMLAEDIKGRLPVHYAAENGHCTTLSLFLENRSTLKGLESRRDNQGYTPETLAVQRGHLEILKMLHVEGEKWDAVLLAKAAAANQLLIVEYLLNEGVSPDGSPGSGTTPLCLAAAGGFVQVVRSLLRQGARVNLTNSDRQGPLYLAVKHKQREVAQILLDDGREPRSNADSAPTKGSEAVIVDAPDSSRLTALHVAASNGEISLVKILIDRGADVESRSRTKQIPLHLAVQAGQLEAAQLLVDEKSDSMFAIDNKSRTPIEYAIEGTNLAMVRVLFERIKAQNMGGPVGISDDLYPLKNRRRDVVAAIKNSAVGIVDFMLHLFPEIMQHQDPTSVDSTSLLHIAAQNSTAETVALLLELGMDVNLVGDERETPLHVAAEHGNVDAIKALLKRNPHLEAVDEDGMTPLLTAICLCGSKERVGETCRLLLEAKASTDNSGSHGKTPLFEASYDGLVKVVEVLLEFGADVNELSYSDLKWSSLHAAADNPDICRLLVSKGANVNYQKSDLWTPLHLACLWNSAGGIQFLLEHNADASLLNEDGNAPLHVALEGNREHSVRALVDYHATNPSSTIDFELPGRNGHLPIHIAARSSSKNIIGLLAQQVGRLGLQAQTPDGLTCLDIAVRVPNTEAVAILLEVGDWERKDLVRLLQHSIVAWNWNTLRLLIDDGDSSLLEAISVEGDPAFSLETIFEKAVVPNLSGSVPIMVTSRLFLDQCQKRENEVTPELAFRSLRFATELDDPTLWDELMDLGFGRKVTNEMVDQDAWTLNDHVVQSKHKVGDLKGADPSLGTRVATAKPASMILPEIWHEEGIDYDSLLEIKQGGTEISFSYSDQAVSLRSAHGFPPRSMGDVYFEVTIQGETTDPDLVVTIGLCGEFSNLKNANPGWPQSKWSIGYHGDDGGIFDDSGSPVNTDGPRFGPGNTVGCGIDYAKKQCFFTVDGRVVLKRESTGIFRKVYPCVSHRYGAAKVKLKLNFGPGGFMWNKDDQLNVVPDGLRRRPTEGLGV